MKSQQEAIELSGKSELRREKQLLGVVITLLLLVKCAPFDYEGTLPNGYKLYEFNSSEIGIALKSRDVLFSGNIEQMGVKDSLVFGRVDEFPPEIEAYRDPSLYAPPGYFILDTKTSAFQLGLAKEEWLNQLEKSGISGEPSLRFPVVFADEPRFITIAKLIIFLGVLKFLILPLNLTQRNRNQQG